jgi:PAS domain S-box-containing protein
MSSHRNRLSWDTVDLDSPLHLAMLVSLVAILCYETARLAYALRIPPDHVASFWPATPFLVAVLLLVPRKIWPALIAAGLGAMALGDLENGVPIGSIIWFSLGDLVAVLGATLGMHRLFKGVPHLSNLKTLAQYLVIAVILTPVASALVGARASLNVGYWPQWRLWFFSDALAFLTVTPAILSWAREGRAWARKSHSYLELAALMTLLVFFGYLTFMGTGRKEPPALFYSLVPLLLWAALRLGLKGVSTSIVVIACLSIWGAAYGRGPFTEVGSLNTLLSLQLFLFFAAIPFMFLAVLVEGQKRAQQSLIEEEAQLAEAQRLAKVGSWQWDPNTDTAIWSEQLYRIAGRDPHLSALNHKEQPQLYTPESWERLRRAEEEALRSGTPFELDLEIVRPDGTTRWVIARGEAQRDTTGRIVQLRGTGQDVTERRLAQEELRESEERFRLAAQAGKMYAYEWDVATDMVMRSEEHVNVLGFSDEATPLTRQQLLAKVHPDDRALFIGSVDKLTSQNPTTQISYRVLRPDGSVVWLEKNARALFDEKGRMLRVVGMVKDITERKQAEEALARLSRRLIEAQEQERTRIARELHDDIGQRLAFLAVEIEQFRQNSPDLPAEVRNGMGELQNQTSEIATDIQSLSHELHSSKLEYLGIAAAMRGFCGQFGEQQNVEIDFKIPDLPSPLSPDISLCLFRVLQEALHNSAKHSGVRHFEVRLWGASDEIHLAVSDSGAGFDSEAAKEGRGLGLISMEERLKLVKGTLSIESQPKRGTTIHARVPLGSGRDSMRAVG